MAERNLFYRLGKSIYRYKWLIVILFFALAISCIPLVSKIMVPFTTIGFNDSHSESSKAMKMIDRELGYSDNQIIVIYKSKTLLATDPEFLNKMKDSLSGLKSLTIKYKIIYPDSNQTSKNKHTAYATILLKGDPEKQSANLPQILAKIKQPSQMTMVKGGVPIFANESKELSRNDLVRADYIALPLALIIMLIVFRSVVAAFIPIILGLMGLLFTLISLFILGHYLKISIFALNIAALLSLGLNLDYSLLLISRFREELKLGKSPEEAIAITLNTAGKSIFFSALAVVISLSALLFFHINFLVSVGIGGIIAVLSSAVIAIFMLTALLSIFKSRVNLLAIKILPPLNAERKGAWRWLMEKVVNRPFMYFISIIVIILFLSYPLINIKLNLSDARILPKSSESHQVFDIFQKEFGQEQLPIFVIIQTTRGNILTSKNIGNLYDFANQLEKDPRVKQVNSIVTQDSKLNKKQLQQMLSSRLPQGSLLDYVNMTTTKGMTVLAVKSKYVANSPEALALIQKIRNSNPGKGLTIKVTGVSANLTDIFANIMRTLPYAIAWIVICTYLILLILFRSLFLPLKAILMNIISLSASYGVLVFVFQEGHFQHLLNFQPLGYLEITSLVVILCALFGTSMDYEVFMLTRIKEYYEQTKDNKASIILGTERSSKIITSAALVLILVCVSFLSAHIILIKLFGLGVAVAVFIDAFLIRIFLVPSTMTLLKSWNWYLPKWMDKILPKVSFNPNDKT